MNSLIKETNDNLRVIIDTLKGNLDSVLNALENIQIQMDKKVEEAKSYKERVDEAKNYINDLENDNKSLELSLKEITEKYGKLNLVSVIEAGNTEINAKINDNNREINKQKENIAQLTDKARTIKDLLLNLKKDKVAKEDKLNELEVIYDFYSVKLNSIIEYSFNNSENLSNYKNDFEEMVVNNVKEDIDINNIDNTLIFDEIANIDEKNIFKDEMTFITDQIEENILNDKAEFEEESDGNQEDYTDEEYSDYNEIEDEEYNELEDAEDSRLTETEVQDNFEEETTEDEEQDGSALFNSVIEEDYYNDEIDSDIVENVVNLGEIASILDAEIGNDYNDETFDELNLVDDNKLEENNEFINANDNENENNIIGEEVNVSNNVISDVMNFAEFNNNLVTENFINEEEPKTEVLDLNGINFENIEESPVDEMNLNEKTVNNGFEQSNENGLIQQIDNAYEEAFNQPVEETINIDAGLLDIFGNPISNEDISSIITQERKIEEVFVTNGIDFNKFREHEQNYLKEIYDEQKFGDIFEVLKNHRINLDNIYKAFNIFGEISAEELDMLISKFVSIGQSVEAIGLILEKLPRVKNYKIDEAIMSYGDYIRDIDIVDLIMKAKELSEVGGN